MSKISAILKEAERHSFIQQIQAIERVGETMEITCPVIFFFLQRSHDLNHWNKSAINAVVSAPMIYSHARQNALTDKQGLLFLSGQNDIVDCYVAGCSYLFVNCQPATPLQISCDAATICGDMDMVALLHEIYGICSSLLAWDISLKDALLNGADLARLFSVAQTLFPYPFYIANRNYNILIYTPDCIDIGLFARMDRDNNGLFRASAEGVNMLNLSPGFAGLQERTDVFLYDFSIFNLDPV
ncbi:MAG: hypothetical protein FWG10_06100 [Eubacteriaceae bacterium]|nr:hypothetical protein [Eubacteriaceae bacterium]